ncbi:MAG: hypothetical protein PHO48_04665 [Candidatus Gracilibacteria bacterium]|nr:hypothetical protein [Candidatus Gracilibacteria bacterium]
MINNLLLNQIAENPVFRKELTTRSLFWFYHVYMERHLNYPTAEFQKILLLAASDSPFSIVITMAFPSSGKSLITSLSLPLWGIISGRYREVWVIGDDKKSTRMMLSRIQDELVCNQRLREDFKSRSNNHGSRIIFPKISATIRSFSLEDDFTLAFNGPKPDLIVIDNPKKYKQCLNIINSKDVNTRLIIVGRGGGEKGALNRLCSLVKKKQINNALALKYAFLDEDGKPVWREKFPTKESINIEFEKINSDIQKYYYEYLFWDTVPEFFLAFYNARHQGQKNSKNITLSFGVDKKKITIIYGTKTPKLIVFDKLIYDGKRNDLIEIKKAISEAIEKFAQPDIVIEFFVPDLKLGNQLKKIFPQFTILFSELNLDKQKRYFELCNRFNDRQAGISPKLASYLVENNFTEKSMRIIDALMCCGRSEENFKSDDPREIPKNEKCRFVFCHYFFQEINTPTSCVDSRKNICDQDVKEATSLSFKDFTS